MAKTWYPVVDYLACTECGTCVGFCPHSVYDKKKAPSPVVIYPDGCIDHCHGCGSLCPQGAITYVGDDTGWVPPHGEKPAADNGRASGCGCGGAADDDCGCGTNCDCGSTTDDDCGCGSNGGFGCGSATDAITDKDCGCCQDDDCGCGSNGGCSSGTDDDCGCGTDCGSGCGCGADSKCAGGAAEPDIKLDVLMIDYLYLDMDTCDRCMGTYEVLADAVKEITPALRAAGYTPVLNKFEIADAALAQQHRFLSSPTIRVNGRDINLQVRENACAPCGDISGQATQCRLFVYNGKEYEVPPRALLARALLQTAFAPEGKETEAGPYQLPENLKAFFDGKNKKSECGCGGKCC